MGWTSYAPVTGLTIYRFGHIRILRITGASCSNNGLVCTVNEIDIPNGYWYCECLQVISGGKVYPALITVEPTASTNRGQLKAGYYAPTSVVSAGTIYGVSMYIA